jgi:tRNA nucleotidyltransferase/poly(A) polymerase
VRYEKGKSVNLNNNLLQIFMILRGYSQNNYLVGGCVRDSLIGREPKDFDIVTDVHMDTIEAAFIDNGWTVDSVGKQFLVMFVSKNGEQYEIANFRKDVGFSDGRRPDEAIIGDLITDAARRDFTVNSIYYDPINGSYLDPNNGMKDAKDRILRFIGKPQERIREDYLRIFRFYRFLSKGFTPDKKSLKACRELFTEAYGQITPERVRMEVERMVL